jgi:LysR family transcriptional regulator for metE and metH
LFQAERALMAEAGGPERQIVRLGQATYSRFHWLRAFIERLAQNAPNIEIDLSAAATQRPFAELRAGTVDVVTVYGNRTEAPQFRWQRLARDPLVAVIAPSHPLAAELWIDGRHIAHERYFAYPLTNEPGFTWEAVLGAPSEPFRQITSVQSPEAVIDLDWWAVTRASEAEDSAAATVASTFADWSVVDDQGMATLGFESEDQPATAT